MSDFSETVDEFRQLVEATAHLLLALPDDVAARRPVEGKWSAKEIIGHLIDSAANNHARFVRAQTQADLVFAGYDQEQWVAAQDYQNASWELLVNLWRTYNLHLAHVMATAPESERARPRLPHSLERIAWQTVDTGKPASLEYLMLDYIGHLRNHLQQIFPDFP